MSAFRDDAKQTLFDIASCKCTDVKLCKCLKEKKVPIEERKFLHDQRTVRRMMIGNVDGPRTKALMAKVHRKEIEAARVVAYRDLPEASTSKSHESVDWGENSNSSETDLDPDYLENVSETETVDDSESAPGCSQQRRRLTNTAKAAERHALSDRATAEIASSVLADYEIISSDNVSDVIDRSKIRRERQVPRIHLR